MAENKTKPTKVSVASFIDQLADQTKRADAKALVKLMQEVTGEPPKMWGPSIIGFGTSKPFSFARASACATCSVRNGHDSSPRFQKPKPPSPWPLRMT